MLSHRPANITSPIFPKSSTSSSSSSSKKTMEEVWNEINLDSLEDQLPNKTPPGAALLQDFLAAPFHKTPQITKPPQNFSVQAPATVLSLGLGSQDFQYLNNESVLIPVWPHPKSHSHAILASPKNMVKEKGQFVPVQQSVADSRHKRMIKNRESASRFRARQQAYTCELEIELVALKKENAKLRRMNQTLFAAAPSEVLAKKHSLRRTSSNPF